MTDKRINNGGSRPGSGRKPKPDDEKKLTISFYVKKKHKQTAIAKIQPIVDRLNKK